MYSHLPDSVEVPCDNTATGNVNSNDGVNNGAVNDGPEQLERTQSDASSTGSLQPDPQEVVIRLKIKLQPSCCRHCQEKKE